MMKNNTKGNNAYRFLIIIASVLYALAVFSVVAGFFNILDYSVLSETKGGHGEIAFELDFAMSSYFSNAGVFFIWGTVLLLIARKAKRNLQKTSSPAQTEEKRMPQGIEEPAEKIICAYCDNELENYNKKCPYCGASRKIRKKI